MAQRSRRRLMDWVFGEDEEKITVSEEEDNIQ